MNELALFAGAGGGILGGILCGFKTICYVEWEKYCIEVIKARIKDGIYEDAPIWGNIQTFDGKPWAGKVDIITGGFPCQPFSKAGKRLGKKDSKNMWPSTARIIKEVRSTWCLLENVPAILGDYFGQIITDLAKIGYDVWWGCLSASTIGAPHQRERVWIVAHSKSKNASTCQHTANRKNTQIQPRGFFINKDKIKTWKKTTHNIKPYFMRGNDGMADRNNRLKAIGNGQVPAVVQAIWQII
jgi:DNA (cytosine-5)-methyltransferase 1